MDRPNVRNDCDHGGEHYPPGATAKGGYAAGRKSLWCGFAVLPVLVLLPLINQPLIADHRFNVFQYGGALTQRPWRVITDPIASIPNYFEHGNFRPLGRMVEQALDLAAFSLSRALDLPVGVSLRVVAMICVALLCLATVLWAETVSGRDPLLSAQPSIGALLIALAVPLVLVGAFPSAVVLFTALYFISAALVLIVATVVARRRWFDSGNACPIALGAAALGGACLGAFNEIAYLAVPLAAVTVAARGLLTLQMTPVALIRTTAARMVLALAAGFVMVFAPVRLIIAQRCSDRGGCYSPSELSISGAVFRALENRMVSALPPTPWTASGVSPAEALPGGNLALLGLHALVILVALLLWRGVSWGAMPSPRGVAALAVAGGSLIFGAGLAMALTSEIQDRVSAGQLVVGTGWRETGLATAGTALVVAALGLAVVRLCGRLRGQRGAAVSTATVVGLLTVGAMTTLGVNAALADSQRPGAEAALFDNISVALLDGDPEKDDVRCGLLDDFVDLHPSRHEWQDRLSTALESASQAWHGAPFCSGTSDD